jgi:hypothetical protein
LRDKQAVVRHGSSSTYRPTALKETDTRNRRPSAFSHGAENSREIWSRRRESAGHGKKVSGEMERREHEKSCRNFRCRTKITLPAAQALVRKPVYFDLSEEIMQNRRGKHHFNRKKLSNQNWNVNMAEQIRQWEAKMRGKGKLTIFILKAAFIVLCAMMLRSIYSDFAPMNHAVNFVLFGIATMAIFTAVIFLSGYADPESFWGRIDRRRQKRTRYDNRFTIKRILLSELWIVYTVFLCFMLQDIILSSPALPKRTGGIALFVIFTALVFIAAMLLSGPRSFWGRVRRFITGERPSYRRHRN